MYQQKDSTLDVPDGYPLVNEDMKKLGIIPISPYLFWFPFYNFSKKCPFFGFLGKHFQNKIEFSQQIFHYLIARAETYFVRREKSYSCFVPDGDLPVKFHNFLANLI